MRLTCPEVQRVYRALPVASRPPGLESRHPHAQVADPHEQGRLIEVGVQLPSS